MEEVKNVLISKKNKDSDCISLYEVAKLIKTKKHQYERMKGSYQENLGEIINRKYSSAGIYVSDFNYYNNELCIGLYIKDNLYRIKFSKNNGDFFLINSERREEKNILAVLGNRLSELYDEFMNYEDFLYNLILILNQ